MFKIWISGIWNVETIYSYNSLTGYCMLKCALIIIDLNHLFLQLQYRKLPYFDVCYSWILCTSSRLLHVHWGVTHASGSQSSAADLRPARLLVPSVFSLLLPHVRIGHGHPERAAAPRCRRFGHGAVEKARWADHQLDQSDGGLPLWCQTPGTHKYINEIAPYINKYQTTPGIFPCRNNDSPASSLHLDLWCKILNMFLGVSQHNSWHDICDI